MASGSISEIRPGECPVCGHRLYDIDRSLYCPCEDCHKGGAVVRADGSVKVFTAENKRSAGGDSEYVRGQTKRNVEAVHIPQASTKSSKTTRRGGSESRDPLPGPGHHDNDLGDRPLEGVLPGLDVEAHLTLRHSMEENVGTGGGVMPEREKPEKKRTSPRRGGRMKR